MEENPVQEIPSSEEPQLKRFFGFSAENTKWVLLFLLILLSLAGGLFLNLRGNSTNKPPQKTEDNTSKKNEFIAPNSIVYGYWTKENSVIAVLDLSTNQNSTIAELSSNIKHVRILDPQRIIYIKDADDRDYGKEIVTRNLETKTEATIVKADDAFGIDDYVVSPNARYLAVWEVSPPDGSTQLFGGKSRVYTVDTQKPLQKNLIYDETSGLGITLAYPIAITDKGELFTDRFLPNSGAGWGYGMAVSDFSGTNKQDIPSLANGMISAQPIVSEDGRRLLFAGYDGRKGSGVIEIDGYRRAMLIPNTIEIFDLSTRQKRTLLTADSNEIYSDAHWDILNENVIYKLAAKEDLRSGDYTYNLRTNTSKKISLGDAASVSVSGGSSVSQIAGSFSQDQFLVFDKAVSESALGNLGSKYNQAINSVYIYDETSQTKKTINLNAGLTQFITLKPEKYFSFLNSLGSSSTTSGRDRNQLQLQTFELKPSLAPKRTTQQSKHENPSSPSQTCDDLAVKSCNINYGTKVTLEQIVNNDLKVPAWVLGCFRNFVSDPVSCADSPLYLYGEEGQKTSIYIGTPIFSANVNYSPVTGFAVSLGENGLFIANGEQVSSLKFDYTPAIKIKKPTEGYLVTKNRIRDIVEKISDQLGLNEREIADTLNFIKEKVDSPYIFISLFDDQTSRQILPLMISPVPDTYRNIVFYIENLDENPNVSYAPPVVEKIQRKGFTAIEISFIVR